MSDKKTGSALEITPGDVAINEHGTVEIINPQLAEAIKTAVAKAGTRVSADDNTGCGNNLYQCKPKAALA
ncbi:MAG TPA: hypothetical protein VJT71_10970 [Pyrinomonadaceae bacterium]|nr:hypothetical protein [Pyrinomonadaceae bacterium]